MPAATLIARLVVALAAMVAACAAPAGASPPRSSTDGSAGTPPRATQLIATAGSGQARPPAAILLGTDGGAALGALGSWTFEGGGSDSPWLPASSLTEVRVASGGRLEVRLDGGEQIGAWSARAAAAADTTGRQPVGLGSRDEAEPALDRVTLEALGPGRWVLSVRLDLAGGRGDVTCYWLVSVG